MFEFKMKQWVCVGIFCSFLLVSVSDTFAQQDAKTAKAGQSKSGDLQRYDHNGVKKKLPTVISFNAHIRPIMSNTCFSCHGPDKEARESLGVDLRLDRYEYAVKESGAIKPGNAKESPVYQRIMDSEDPMPPAEFIHRLSDYEKALFKKWIDDGAKFQKHWSFTPIVSPKVPHSEQINKLNQKYYPTSRSKVSKDVHPVDSFILAKLLGQKIDPTEIADKRSLIRRLCLDLTGLPPSTQQVQQFLNDTRPDAYERLVDRLLASPRYGERMASRWLDIVKFADTVGFHGDQNQRIFPYRDYVIESLNSNQPFDEFTKEQLAGDLLKNPTEKQLIATGLVRLNMMTREGGAQPKEYLAKYTAERVRMVGTAWLGLTTGCCECHNHKYDPLTIKDFYSLGAFFDDVKQWGVYNNYPYTPNPDLKGFNNSYPFPPEMRIRSESLTHQMNFLERRFRNLSASEFAKQKKNQLDSNEFKNWLAALESAYDFSNEQWKSEIPTKFSTTKAAKSSMLKDGSLLLTGQPTKGQTIRLEFSKDKPFLVRTIQVEVLPDKSNQDYVGRGQNGSFSANVSFSIHLDPKNKLTKQNRSEAKKIRVQPAMSKGKKSKSNPLETPLELAWFQADRSRPKQYYNGYPILHEKGVWRSGPSKWQLPIDETKKVHTAIYHLKKPTLVKAGQKFVLNIKSTDIGRVRISFLPVSRAVVGTPSSDSTLIELLKSLKKSNPADSIKNLTSDQQQLLYGLYYQFVTPFDKQPPELRRLRDEIERCHSGFALTMVSQPVKPNERRVSRVLARGNWQDESGPIVDPDTPEFLQSSKLKTNRKKTRLDLANWLTSPDNPLTARHFVNRTWKHFFGAGISDRLDDLGNQGEWPSHPQLLDWLASEFQKDWDRKRLVRLIVTSNTYKQKAAVRRDLGEIDPYNRLLSQQSARRLEAEAVRDNALAISGLLNTEWIGGPGIRPWQPKGYYSNLQFPNRVYSEHTDGRQYRRSVYMHWQRTFLHPMLTNFDAPMRDECVADRNQSNSPQQALTLLNDPQFNEMSCSFASRLMDSYGIKNLEQAIVGAFEISFARKPVKEEIKALLNIYQTQLDHYQKNPDQAAAFLKIGNFAKKKKGSQAQHAALAQVCRVILNMHETITRY